MKTRQFLLALLSMSGAMLLNAQTATMPELGNGSSGTPYQISSWQHLYWISQDAARWNLHYVQTADIDLSSASPSISTWDGGAGWTPIGNTSTNFTGSYNGQFHTINGLVIDRTGTDYIGLFGYVSGAEISNLGISGGSVKGKARTGGMIGAAYGSAAITKCCNANTVEGSSEVGGLVGLNYNGVITLCYNTGTIGNGVVTTSGSSYVGGLVGHNSIGLVQNSYNTGTINGGYWGVGGLIGYNNTDGGTVENCYSTGQVIAYPNPDPTWGLYRYGGLVGDCCSGPVTNSYWDTQTSGTTLSPSGKGTGKTTAEMKQQSTFSGWDFSVLWEIVGGSGANYPRLQSNPDPALPVELTSFSATAKERNIALRWTTATETNNHGFEVERKELNHRLIDPLNQSNNVTMNQWTNESISLWHRIGFVEGNGSSNTAHEYSFYDRNVGAGTYSFRLKQIDRGGSFRYSEPVEVTVIAQPAVFGLQQNYPNPFNPVTVISYQVSAVSHTTLTIHDAIGRKAAVLVDEVKQPGTYTVTFDGSQLTSGIYFVRLSSGNKLQIRRMMLLK